MASHSPTPLHQGQILALKLTEEITDHRENSKKRTLILSDASKAFLVTQASQAKSEACTFGATVTVEVSANKVLKRDKITLPNIPSTFEVSYDDSRKQYKVVPFPKTRAHTAISKFIGTELTKQLNQEVREEKETTLKTIHQNLRDITQQEFNPHRADDTDASRKLAKLKPKMKQLPVFNKANTEKEKKEQLQRMSRAFTKWESHRDDPSKGVTQALEEAPARDPLQSGITPAMAETAAHQDHGIDIAAMMAWDFLEEIENKDKDFLTPDQAEIFGSVHNALLEAAEKSGVNKQESFKVTKEIKEVKEVKEVNDKSVSVSAYTTPSKTISDFISEGLVESVEDAAINSPQLKGNVVHLKELLQLDLGSKPVVFFDADEVLIRGDFVLPLPKKYDFVTLDHQKSTEIQDVIKGLKAKGASVFVLSSSGHNILPKKLEQAGIDTSWFDGVYGQESHGLVYTEDGDFIGYKNKGYRALEIYQEHKLDTHRPIVLIDDGLDNLDAMDAAAKRLGCQYTPVHFTGAIEYRHMQLAQKGYHYYDTLAAYYSDHQEDKEIAAMAKEKKTAMQS